MKDSMKQLYQKLFLLFLILIPFNAYPFPGSEWLPQIPNKLSSLFTRKYSQKQINKPGYKPGFSAKYRKLSTLGLTTFAAGAGVASGYFASKYLNNSFDPQVLLGLGARAVKLAQYAKEINPLYVAGGSATVLGGMALLYNIFKKPAEIDAIILDREGYVNQCSNISCKFKECFNEIVLMSAKVELPSGKRTSTYTPKKQCIIDFEIGKQLEEKYGVSLFRLHPLKKVHSEEHTSITAYRPLNEFLNNIDSFLKDKSEYKHVIRLNGNKLKELLPKKTDLDSIKVELQKIAQAIVDAETKEDLQTQLEKIETRFENEDGEDEISKFISKAHTKGVSQVTANIYIESARAAHIKGFLKTLNVPFNVEIEFVGNALKKSEEGSDDSSSDSKDDEVEESESTLEKAWRAKAEKMTRKDIGKYLGKLFKKLSIASIGSDANLDEQAKIAREIAIYKKVSKEKRKRVD